MHSDSFEEFFLNLAFSDPQCTAFDFRIQAGNGGKLSCSQAELTQTIKAAVDMFASISCQYPEIRGAHWNNLTKEGNFIPAY